MRLPQKTSAYKVCPARHKAFHLFRSLQAFLSIQSTPHMASKTPPPAQIIFSSLLADAPSQDSRLRYLWFLSPLPLFSRLSHTPCLCSSCSFPRNAVHVTLPLILELSTEASPSRDFVDAPPSLRPKNSKPLLGRCLTSSGLESPKRWEKQNNKHNNNHHQKSAMLRKHGEDSLHSLELNKDCFVTERIISSP